MKKVTLTNATVIPFYKYNSNDSDEILRIIPPRNDSDFSSYIISFNVETKVKDSAESKMRLFERCTVFAKTQQAVDDLKSTIQLGTIVEIEGYESKTKDKKTDKYYTNIIVSGIIPISKGIEPAQKVESTTESSTSELSASDLPF